MQKSAVLHTQNKNKIKEMIVFYSSIQKSIKYLGRNLIKY